MAREDRRTRARLRERADAQRLQLALSAGQLGDWSWEAASNRVTVGKRAAKYFGVPGSNPVTWSDLLAVVHPSDRERVSDSFTSALRDQTDYDIEYRVVRPDKSIAWIAVKGRGLYEDHGGASGMIGVVQDVSERKKLELVQHRLAAVVESSEDAIVSKDLNGIIQTWNSGAERIFGYTAEEMIGTPVLRLIPPELHGEEAEILARQRRGERVEHYETVRVTKDRRRIDVSLTVSPIRDASGVVIGASKVARDITARKRAEEALREEARVINVLNETGKAIAAALDLEALVQTVTEAAVQLSGAEFGAFFFKVPDGRGESFRLFSLTGPDRERFKRFGQSRVTSLFALMSPRTGAIRVEDSLKDERFGDAPQVRSYLATPVVSRDGVSVAGLFLGHSAPGVFTERIERLIVGIASHASVGIDNARLYEDVKRAAEARQQLLEAERRARSEAERVSFMKDEFLATLSHELRTPLNAIVGWAQLLRNRSHTDGEVREGLAVIDRNARIQTQLIEDLLDTSRIISGKVRLENQRVDLQDVVRSAIASVRHLAEAKGVDLRMAVEPPFPPVWGDPSRLQQCVWNLVSNAIKFTPSGGLVKVTLERAGDLVRFTVADTGQGVDPEFLPHLFERFRQADSSSTRVHGGLGLGLSIVKSLVQMHGGSVQAASEGPGKGATFSIDLPVMSPNVKDDAQRDDERAARDLPPVTDHPSLKGLVVLVIDDEPDALNLMARVLVDCGARVFTAASARDGFEILTRERPDIMISDIGMPDEDGYMLIRKVRALKARQGGKIPAAAVSAFARPEDRTKALRAGYQMHLAKPVDPTELTAVVASLATRKSPTHRHRM